jgi:hypothetical protein
MSLPNLFRVALMLGVVTTGWSQSPPEGQTAHHPPQAAMHSNDELAALRQLIEKAEMAKTAAERERLLEEHLAAMRKQLEMTRSQHCEMDMMTHGPATGGGMKDRPMMMCHQMMKSRMETIQELLEQTWRREELRRKGAR